MARRAPALDSMVARTFGSLLRFQRRRLQLTQRALGLAVGYGEAQISRLEKDHRHAPDLTTLVALFVPALHLEDEPAMVARLLALAAESRGESLADRQVTYARKQSAHAQVDWMIESPPPAPPSAIARAATIARLRAHLVRDGALIVCGLPGMGKTTLAAEIARAEVDAGPVCWLMVRPGVHDKADAVVRYLAAYLYSLGREETEPILDPARDAGPLSLDRALAAITGACHGLGRVLVCIDNAHLILADEPALSVLRHLHSVAAIRLLLTSRVELPLAGIRQEWLDGLAPDEARALLAQLCPALTPTLAEALLTRVAGSPILIRLAAGQLPTDTLDAHAFIDSLATQPQISDYLAEGVLGQLSPSARELVQLIAIFRRPVDVLEPGLVDLIQHRLHLGDVSAAIAELQRHHLVPHPTQASLHPLLRDRIQAHLAADGRARRLVHGIATHWLEQHSRDPLEAGYHAVQAGDWARVADLLADQAERLLHLGQAASAAELLGQALARIPARTEPDLVRRLLIGRGDLLVNSPQAEQADGDYRRALALTENSAVRAHIIAKLAVSLIYRGHAADALQLAQAAAADLAPADTLLHGQLAAVICAAQVNTGEYEMAAANGERALALADQLAALAPREADAIRAPTHNSLGALKHMRGLADEALRQLSAAAAAARRADLERVESRAIFNVGNVHFTRGDYERALDHYQRALTGLERSGERYVSGRVQTAIAVVHYLRAELGPALSAHERAIELKRSVGDAIGVAHAQGQQARVMLALGQIDQARALLEHALGATLDLGQSRSRAGLFVILAEAQLCAGDAEGSIATLNSVRDFPGLGAEPWFHADWQTHMAVARLAQGDIDTARALLTDPAADAIGGEVTLERALADSLLALRAGDAAAARAQADRVAASARACGCLLLARRADRLSPDPQAFWGRSEA